MADESLWMLLADRKVQRMQDTAVTDDGTAIAAWVFSTGYAVGPKVSRMHRLLLDATGTVTARGFIDATSGTPTKNWGSGENELAMSPAPTGIKWRLQLSAANTVQVRRALVEISQIDKRGV